MKLQPLPTPALPTKEAITPQDDFKPGESFEQVFENTLASEQDASSQQSKTATETEENQPVEQEASVDQETSEEPVADQVETTSDTENEEASPEQQEEASSEEADEPVLTEIDLSFAELQTQASEGEAAVQANSVAANPVEAQPAVASQVAQQSGQAVQGQAKSAATSSTTQTTATLDPLAQGTTATPVLPDASGSQTQSGTSQQEPTANPALVAKPAAATPALEAGFVNQVVSPTAVAVGELQPVQETVVVQTNTTASPTASQQVEDDGISELNASRVARGLQNAVAQKGGTLTLRATPVELGTIRIQLSIQGTSVSAQIATETEATRQMLTQQINQLRQSLENQGLTVDRLQVQTMGQSAEGQTSTDQQSNQDAQGRNRGQFNGQRQQLAQEQAQQDAESFDDLIQEEQAEQP